VPNGDAGPFNSNWLSHIPELLAQCELPDMHLVTGIPNGCESAGLFGNPDYFSRRRIPMTRTSRTQRLVMLAASTALAAGGALIPSGAFAATPATPHTGTVTAVVAGHQGHQAGEITGLSKNSTTTTTSTTVKKELTAEGLRITTTTKTTKITRNSEGDVIKKVVKTTTKVKTIRIDENDRNNHDRNNHDRDNNDRDNHRR
jgi:predicted nucleic acid-binding protein